MYGHKKDEDVFVKYLRESHLGEHGIWTGSADNSFGLEERRRRQEREREAAEAERARLAEWDRQQAAQRAGSSHFRPDRQNSSGNAGQILGWLGNAFLYLMAMAALGGLLNGLGLI
jgi:hypothetical protein